MLIIEKRKLNFDQKWQFTIFQIPMSAMETCLLISIKCKHKRLRVFTNFTQTLNSMHPTLYWYNRSNLYPTPFALVSPMLSSKPPAAKELSIGEIDGLVLANIWIMFDWKFSPPLAVRAISMPLGVTLKLTMHSSGLAVSKQP